MVLLANATFYVTDGYEEFFSKNENGEKLTTGKFTIVYEGEMAGESILMELKNNMNKSNSTVYGLERFTGKIAGRSGSIVLEHKGYYENGSVTTVRKIVSGSGTNELININGEILFTSKNAKEYHITLEYSFEN